MFCFTSRVTNRISALTVRRTLISSPHGALDSRRLLHNPEGVRLGWSKDVISNFLPFTSELITSKGRPFENIAIGYCPAQPPVVTAEDKIGKKRIDDSWLEIILPFSDHSALRDSMIRTDGTTIRHGKLFEILDGLAGDVSYRHCGGRSKDLTIVTASVDGMKTSASIDIKNDLKLQGYLTYVGRSSMEVAIDLISISPEGSSKVVGNIQFIMVARNETGTASHPVCGLLLANEEARQKFAQGKERVAERKERALSSLSLTPPRPEEISLIHSLYLESMNLKAQKDLIMQNQLAQLVASLKDSPGTATVGSSFQSLSEPHLFRSKFKWMRNTIFKNVEIMFPQDRNVHGKIFGGYLMRKAFELAWVSAVCFTGEQNPCFLYVDDIQFVKPVSIGSVMEFSSTVVYSRDQYMVVQVLALDVNPANAVKSKTNIYRYVFRANAAAGTSLPQVMPREYEEIVLYLEGKRSLDQLLLDDEHHSV